MPFETRRRLQAALPQQTATVFRHTAHYPTPSRTNPAPTGAGRNHKGTMMKLKIDIATNNFKHGGGTERYTLDLVKGLNRQNITPAVYATKFDHGIPEYAMIEPHLVDQRRTLKKLRSFLFSSRLAQTRKNSAAKLIACHHADYADLLIYGGTHLGYLHHMAQKPNLLDRLAIRRNRSNYATAKLIVAHSHMMRRELVGLYGVPPERIQVAPPPPQIRNASFHNLEKLPPCAPNTVLPTMKPFSYSHRPATRAKAWNCSPTFSNKPNCPSSSPLPVHRFPAR